MTLPRDVALSRSIRRAIMKQVGDTRSIDRVAMHGRYDVKVHSTPSLQSLIAMIDVSPTCSFDQLVRAIEGCGYDIRVLTSKSRKRDMLYVRYAIIHHLINTVTPKMSLVEIAEAVGRKCHTTIINARDEMKDLAETGQDGDIAIHKLRISEEIKRIKSIKSDN